MKTMTRYFFILLALFGGVHQAVAQGTTAFTYQGQLHDNGTNANGACTLIFKVYDALTSGNQIGSGITNNVPLANGLFSVNLDFGTGVFNGATRWLDITITNGGVTQTLSPRVQVLPTPYAQFAAVAATVTNGGIMNSQLAGNAVNATNIAGGQVVKSLNGLYDSVTLAAGANVTVTPSGNTLTIAGTGGGGNAALATNVVSGINITNAFITNSFFAGNGGGLTNLQLAGTYSNAVTFSNITNAFTGRFTGTGAGLTNLQLAGTYSNTVTFNNTTNVFTGTFIGNGNGVTNIPAAGIVGLTSNTETYKYAVQEATTTGLPAYNYTNSAGTITATGVGALTIDGIAVQPNDSVLVKNEGSGASPVNGIYVCTTNGSAGAGYVLTRRSDFNMPFNIASGDTVFVLQGATNMDTTWVLTNAGPITVGTTPLAFAGADVASLNGLTGHVTLSAGTNIAFFTNGNALIISAKVPSFQVFASSGTFVVATNVTRITVELWGGGGGGSGYNYSDSHGATNYTGGGGGAGGYGWNVFNVIPGSSYTVTTPADSVGGAAGGTTSFGSLLSATGGAAGANATSSGPGLGGAGGISTGGAVNFTSGSGFSGVAGGTGGGAWRGGSGGGSGGGAGSSGPGSGGNGSLGNGSGNGGGSGIVIVYY